MPVTMRDVATKANVSIKTVSRVVNNEGEISDNTRERVLNTIQELGYRPNLVARGLVTQRTRILGLVIPDICNPFFAEVARGVQEVAQETGYSLIIASSEESPREEVHILNTMNSQSVDATIQFSPATPEILRAFGDGARPIVLVNNYADHPAVGSVSSDIYGGAQAAVEHLVARGHRKIAMLSGKIVDPRRARRVRAYRDVLLRHNLPFDEGLVMLTHSRMAEGYVAAKRALVEHPDVTAFFCYNDLLAIGAMRACREAGRCVPRDCAIVGFDDIDMASMITPALTTVRVDKRELGRRAANLALAMLENMKLEARTLFMPTELVVRDSA